MVEIRNYTVTQEREVKVWAESPIEAAQLADAAFRDNIKKGDVSETHIRTPVRDVDLVVRED
jgi:hypothetical protein